MKQPMTYLSLGLALFLASFANQSLGQSTPQQVKGTANGSNWQALTNEALAVAVSATTEYVAWKSDTTEKIMFSAFNGTEWTTPVVVGSANPSWTAETDNPPALAVDDTTGYLWLAWRNRLTDAIFVSTFVNGAWTYREAVAGSNWTAETNNGPALSGGHGISLAWTGHSTYDIWYSYWNYPGWTLQHTVGGSGWAAQSPDAAAGWTQSELVQGLGSISTMFWTDTSGDVFMSNDFPYGWTAEVTVACDGWTAETSIVDTPAAAYFTIGGNFEAAVFWLNQGVQYTYTSGTGCGFAQPATVSGSGSAFFAPAVAVGSNLAILAWNKGLNPHTLDSTIWYIDPMTLPGLGGN